MPLRIALIGASGMIGSRIAAEAARRGHHVTPLGRAQLDALDPAQVAARAAGHDVLASAYAAPAEKPEMLVDATRAILEGAKRAGVRVVAVGGAGSLKLPDGRDSVDSWPRDVPWLGSGLAHREALRLYRASDADWTVLSPSGNIQPGARTGRFRLGKDDLLVDANGEAHISMEDFAVAFVDELERPAHPRARFAVGY